MSDHSDRTAAAMQAYHDRRTAEAQRAEDHDKAALEAEARREQDARSWRSKSALIVNTVMNIVGSDIARQGSPILYQCPPQEDPFSISFELHESGQLPKIATLRFAMDSDGFVSADAVPRCQLPTGRHVDGVAQDWVENVARTVWEAALPT